MSLFRRKPAVVDGPAANGAVPVKAPRTPSMVQAIAPILAMVVFMGAGSIWLGLPAEPMIILSAVVAAIIAVRLGHSFDGLMTTVSEKVAKVFPALLILITVGLLIGAWMAGGTIPMMIYYGLKLVSPQYLYITAIVVTSIVSMCTGTSWGSVGTIGVAFMGVAFAMDGVSLPIVAGAVVSGAYFGDKLSPLSDTTNLTAAVTRVPLYDHIKNLLWTTLPSWVLAGTVMFALGFTIDTSGVGGSAKVEAINGALATGFSFNPLIVLPVLIVLYGSMRKMPTIPVMLVASAVAMVNAVAFQGISIANTFSAITSGFNTDMLRAGFDPGNAAADITTLLDRGGMGSMMMTLLIAFCALVFAGLLSATGSLEVIVEKLLSVVRNTGSLIVATIAVGVLTIATTCNGQISVLMPGELLREAYIRRGVHPKTLGRTLEDSATIIEPILPWTAAGAYMAATLGVATVEYAGWATLCWTGIIFATIWGFTGIGITRLTAAEQEKMLAEIAAEKQLALGGAVTGAEIAGDDDSLASPTSVTDAELDAELELLTTK